jgi:hypothetical protein
MTLGDRPLTLIWYGLARKGAFQHPTYVPLTDGVTLAADDGVQIFLTVEPSAYVYMLHQTTTDQFAVLWPTPQAGFGAFMESGRIQTLPARGRVYNMGMAQGTEAIYIVASLEPIESTDQLLIELRSLFTAAQALALGVPGRRVRESLPDDLVWKLDIPNPPPVSLVDQYIGVATTVQSIGRKNAGAEQVVTTAEGGHYRVSAEHLAGDRVVARVIRLRRVFSE